MSNQEIRIFNIVRGREGDITHAILCTGHRHIPVHGLAADIWMFNPNITVCDSKNCRGAGSEPLDISLLSIANQEKLGLSRRVPQGLVLVTKASWGYDSQYHRRLYSSGETVTPKQLEIGTLLADGEGTTFISEDYGFSSTKHKYINYVRNVGGKAESQSVGREDRKRTNKKLAKLRLGERKSEVAYEVTYLNELMRELMQLHRTPEVEEEIENVKDLLRLASSLSVEASIEAAEGNEQIARELASSRAREIGAGLEQIRERLMLEQRVREEVRKELNDRYDN